MQGPSKELILGAWHRRGKEGEGAGCKGQGDIVMKTHQEEKLLTAHGFQIKGAQLGLPVRSEETKGFKGGGEWQKGRRGCR